MRRLQAADYGILPRIAPLCGQKALLLYYGSNLISTTPLGVINEEIYVQDWESGRNNTGILFASYIIRGAQSGNYMNVALTLNVKEFPWRCELYDKSLYDSNMKGHYHYDQLVQRFDYSFRDPEYLDSIGADILCCYPTAIK